MKFCITCEHWDKEETAFEHGLKSCNKLTGEFSNKNRFFDVATGDEPCPFVLTSCSFGCIFYERR